MLGLAISITARTFEGKKDKGGNPYILHCLRVMYGVDHLSVEARCAAVMHDLIEDTDETSEINYTYEVLRELGFPERVIDILKLLTHLPGVPYDDYIKPIAFDKDARKIKMSDLKDNSDITRLKGISKRDLDRMEKYHKSYLYLSKV